MQRFFAWIPPEQEEANRKFLPIHISVNFFEQNGDDQGKKQLF